VGAKAGISSIASKNFVPGYPIGIVAHKPGELMGNNFGGENRAFGCEITNADPSIAKTKDSYNTKNSGLCLIPVSIEE